MGGSYYATSGGGGNFMCMRADPTINLTDQVRENRAEVYGAEYEYPPKPELHDHKVPCAVCQLTRRSVLMMPGKNVCDEGWTTEYPGYISAERSDEFHFRGEFVCVDDDAEPSAVSNTLDLNGVILTPAQTVCGSLPCLPYMEGKDLHCVVCSC